MKEIIKSKKFWLYSSIVYLFIAIFFVFILDRDISFGFDENGQLVSSITAKIPKLDKEDYDRRLNLLAHTATTTASTTLANATSSKISTSTKPTLWPVKTDYPNDGAILPFKRIIAYYGNFLSKNMGVLGEYPEDVMLAKLDTEVQKWNLADPQTPAIPALHYIVVTAQGKPGEEGKYRLRMPDAEIQKVLTMAKKINALVFLDIQVGQSKIQDELPLLEKYLVLPNVHLAIDPEFAMKIGQIPGAEYVGTMDATDINYCTDFLVRIVNTNKLTPKILIVHRYRENMVTNYKKIKTTPEVQIIMNMDGWGGTSGKIAIYKQYITNQPVQFAGIKLFYKNDLWKPSTTMLTPEEILKLTPAPIYIQYQ